MSTCQPSRTTSTWLRDTSRSGLGTLTTCGRSAALWLSERRGARPEQHAPVEGHDVARREAQHPERRAWHREGLLRRDAGPADPAALAVGRRRVARGAEHGEHAGAAGDLAAGRLAGLDQRAPVDGELRLVVVAGRGGIGRCGWRPGAGPRSATAAAGVAGARSGRLGGGGGPVVMIGAVGGGRAPGGAAIAGGSSDGAGGGVCRPAKVGTSGAGSGSAGARWERSGAPRRRGPAPTGPTR